MLLRRSERDGDAQQPAALPATGDEPAELDRVRLDRRAATAPRPRTSRDAVELQCARLSVPGRPLRGDVSNEHPIVVGGEFEVPTGGTRDGDAVDPGVTRQHDVDEEPHRPPFEAAADGLAGGPGPAPAQPRPPPPPPACGPRHSR